MIGAAAGVTVISASDCAQSASSAVNGSTVIPSPSRSRRSASSFFRRARPYREKRLPLAQQMRGGTDLETRLRAGTDDPDPARIGPASRPRVAMAAGQRRPEVRQPAFIAQDRDDRAGLGRERDHHATRGRQALGGVVVETPSRS